MQTAVRVGGGVGVAARVGFLSAMHGWFVRVHLLRSPVVDARDDVGSGGRMGGAVDVGDGRGGSRGEGRREVFCGRRRMEGEHEEKTLSRSFLQAMSSLTR